jgi:hypothetical protein
MMCAVVDGVAGTVTGVDHAMNTHMKNVKFTAKGKSPVSLEHLSVRGSMVCLFDMTVCRSFAFLPLSCACPRFIPPDAPPSPVLKVRCYILPDTLRFVLVHANCCTGSCLH